MMETFYQAFAKWDASTQFVFSGVILICSVVLIVLGALWFAGLWRAFLENIAILRHGWPEGWAAVKVAGTGGETSSTAPACQHADNLTHTCFRPGGCRTDTDCQKAMDMVNKGQTPGPALRVIFPPDGSSSRSCPHPLNAGGECMNDQRNCQTRSECNQTIESWRKADQGRGTDDR